MNGMRHEDKRFGVAEGKIPKLNGKSLCHTQFLFNEQTCVFIIYFFFPQIQFIRCTFVL